MYTIQLLDPNLSVSKQDTFRQVLNDTIAVDGRFRIGVWKHGTSTLTRRERAEANIEAWQVITIYLQRIRLVAAKPYCGNHPGPCQVTGKKKPNTVFLEWHDWVDFHTLVNGVCDRLRVSANIWTLPPDAKGKMWIRKGIRARIHYDYSEQTDRYGRAVRLWNTGTPDQFDII